MSIDEREADSSKAPSVVELKETKPGVYEPASASCDEIPVRPRLRRRRRSEFDTVENEVVEGFRAGMSMIKRIGKALNVKL